MKYLAIYNSAIGRLLIEIENGFITKIELIKDADLIQSKMLNINDSIFDEIKQWLDNYFENKENLSMPKVKLYGTEFQKLVWEGIKELAKFGQTISYKDLANYVISKTDKLRMSSQAIGNAVGKNSILILIPCHRVVGVNKNLTGFSCGIDAKVWLLEHEGIMLKKANLDKNKWKVIAN